MPSVLHTVALSLVQLVPNVWMLLVPTVIFGFAQSLNIPNTFSLLNEAALSENRGAFISINSTVLRLGQTLGPLLMHAATIPVGLGGAYFVGATLAAAVHPGRRPYRVEITIWAEGTRRWSKKIPLSDTLLKALAIRTLVDILTV